MDTPKLNDFLTSINKFVQNGRQRQIGEYLLIEPPFSASYHELISEVQDRYPAGREAELEKHVLSRVPGLAENWLPFAKFLVHYFYFIVRVDINNLLEAYNLLSDLFIKATAALSTPEYGVLILPTIISYAKILARLAIGLNKQPHLIAHLYQQQEDEDTLPTRAGNIIRPALAATLNDRSTDDPAAATGIKSGSLLLANLWLKILFQCKKTLNAEFIFNMMPRQAPPLPMYPKPQQVTYLYYLGRYQFSNNHFYRALVALQEAFDMCPSRFVRQRRLILVYLLSSSIILGRLPTEELFRLPEAVGFKDRFSPLCRAIRKGDLQGFRVAVDINGEHAAWFLHHRILLQLQARCEVLVWRSLIRRVFLINGSTGDAATRRAPTLDLYYVAIAARHLETRGLLPMSQLDKGPGRRHTNFIFMSEEPGVKNVYVNPEFEGLEEEEMLNAINTGKTPQPGHQLKTIIPDLREIESILSALIHQGLANGYISHAQKRFAIYGSRLNPAIIAGFPNVFSALTARETEDVPGWKRTL